MENRRNFIKKTAIGTAGVSVGLTAFSAKSYGRVLGANERINMGVIGLRGRGKGLMDGFSSMYGEGVFIKTVCDVDTQYLEPSREQVAEKQEGNKPDAVQDLRKIFDDPEIDAVAMATPNHWHALGSIWACQAGKHVYVEKPSSHNIWEGRRMVEAARKYNRLVQQFEYKRHAHQLQPIRLL